MEIVAIIKVDKLYICKQIHHFKKLKLINYFQHFKILTFDNSIGINKADEVGNLSS